MRLHVERPCLGSGLWASDHGDQHEARTPWSNVTRPMRLTAVAATAADRR